MPTVKEAQAAKELGWLLAFQKRCPQCPQSIPEQQNPPAPDILFPNDGLGIEITEYLLGQGKNGSLPRRLETVHERITRAAQVAYEAKLKHRLQVSIHWTAFNECPAPREEGEVAEAIARLVAGKTFIRPELSLGEVGESNDPLLERYGVTVNICPIPGAGPSCWASSACYFFPEEETRIQTVLHDKEPKVSGYRQSCSRLWLLIVADRKFFCSQFSSSPNLSQKTFCSSFDRVFILDEAGDSTYEFKTCPKIV